MQDVPLEAQPKLDVVGVVLSAVGLGLAVFGVLRSGVWGWVRPNPDAPQWLGLSATLWLILAGALIVWLFFAWEERQIAADREPLVRPQMLKNQQLAGGLTMFFFQFLIQAGLFFTVPLFLSVALGLSALDTGIRLLPLSITLLVAAVGIPKYRPQANPRTVVRWGLIFLFFGIASLIGALEVGAGPEIVTIPMLLAGLGVGALASQLGAVTVSGVPDKETGEVGGLQNTMTNLGASLGTALAGSILIAGLTAAFLEGVVNNPDIPEQVSSQAEIELAGGIPFISNAQLETGLADAGVPQDEAEAILDENEAARIVGLRASLAILAFIALIGLFFTGKIPTVPVGGSSDPPETARSEADTGEPGQARP
jgi:Na+/melibiose symporter-like transporter